LIYKNKYTYYFALTIYIIILYRNSILPGGIPYALKVFYGIVFISLIFYIIVFDFSILNERGAFFNKKNAYIIIFFILICFSTFLFNTQEITNRFYLIRLLNYFIFFSISFFLLPNFLLEYPDHFDKLLSFFIWAGFIVALIGILFLVMGIMPLEKFQGYLSSIITHPNYIPPICIIGALSSLYLFYTNRERYSMFFKVLLINSFIIQTLAVLLSLSRTGIIALILGAIIFYSSMYGKKILKFVPFFIPLFPFFVLGFLKAKGFASFVSRFYLLIPAYYMLASDRTKFLWGFGTSDAYRIYTDFMLLSGVYEQDINTPHNAYIQFVMMFGLIFTAVFLFFIFSIVLKNIIKIFKSNGFEIKLYYGFLLSVIISYLFQGLFESQMAMVEHFMMHPFLIFLGISYYSVRRNKQSLVHIREFPNSQ